MNRKCIIFDLDGTLADLRHRLHFIESSPPDWDTFFKNVYLDTPIVHMVRLCQWLEKSRDWDIIIASGRSDVCKQDTITWLKEHGIRYMKLYMRQAGDHRPDDEVKQDILQQIMDDGFTPMMVFDDRDQVVNMWRNQGIPCAQVAPGNF